MHQDSHVVFDRRMYSVPWRLIGREVWVRATPTTVAIYCDDLDGHLHTDELHQLFGDPLLASAAMDRLLHGAHVLRLVGDTFRNPPPDRRRKRHNITQQAAMS